MRGAPDQFDNLDEGVQTEFENFLEERGINSSLALFIPDLAEYKCVRASPWVWPGDGPTQDRRTLTCTRISFDVSRGSHREQK